VYTRRPQTPISPCVCVCVCMCVYVYIYTIRILRSRISRYPDPEVGNSILLSTLGVCATLAAREHIADPAHSPIIVKSSAVLLLY